MPFITMPTKSVRFADDAIPTKQQTKSRWCCRNGWYPALVAAAISIGCLLDLYSSMSCEFLQVHVETDTGESRGSVHIGIYFHQTGAFENGAFGEYLAEGCQRYSDEFEENVIAQDKLWLTTRYIGMISAACGGVAAVACWLLVFTPLPIGCLWFGVILPLVFIAFLAEGLKFLFLDVKVCSAALWYTRSTDCEFATTGYIAIAASVVFFLCAVLVCVHRPKPLVSKDDSRPLSSRMEIAAIDYDDLSDLELQPTLTDETEPMERNDTEPISNKELHIVDEEPILSKQVNITDQEPAEEQKPNVTPIDPDGQVLPLSFIQRTATRGSSAPIDP